MLVMSVDIAQDLITGPWLLVLLALFSQVDSIQH